VNKRVPHPD